MTFSIEEAMASMNSGKALYAEGNIIQHPVLGPICCEEVDVCVEDVLKIQRIKCSIMDHKQQKKKLE